MTYDQQIMLDALKRSAHFAIQRDDLVAHCTARASHHRERSQYYRDKGDALDQVARTEMAHLEGDDALLNKTSTSYGTRVNEREEARSKSITHAKTALKFQWFSEHVAEFGTFHLDVHQVAHFELIP